MKPQSYSKNFSLLLIFIFILTLNSDQIKAQSKFRKTFNKIFNLKNKLKSPKKIKDRENFEFEEDGFEMSLIRDFEMTMDPTLGYAPTERLKIVRDLIDNSFSARGIQGIQWLERGPINVGGRTRAILFDLDDPSHKKVWAGGADGGMWFTDDITNSNLVWNHVSPIWDNLSISCIAQDPNVNSNTKHDIFVGTGESWANKDAVIGNGIYLYDGLSWQLLPISAPATNSDFKYVNKIVVNPKSPHVNSDIRIFVGTDNGLWRLTWGGQWTQVLANGISGCTSDKVTDIEIADDGNGNYDFYAATGWIGQPSGIFKLVSGSSTWIKLTNGLPSSGIDRIELATAPSDRAIIYALINFNGSSGPTHIYKSNNFGSLWTQISPDPPAANFTYFTNNQGYYNLASAVDPSNSDILYVGGINIHRWDGTSWCQLSSWDISFTSYPYLHADQHSIIFRPGSTDFLISNDGGVFYSSASGPCARNFVAKNNGYNTAQLYSCAPYPSASVPESAPLFDVFLMGTQDNATQISLNLTLVQQQATMRVLSGDGGFCFYDEMIADITTKAISSIQYDNFFLSNNYGRSYSLNSQGSLLPLGHVSVINTTPSSPCKSHFFVDPADFDSRRKLLFYSDLYSIENSTPTQPAVCEIPSLSFVDVVNSPQSFTYIPQTFFNTGDGDISSIKISPYPINTVTVFVGTYNGRIFKISDATGTPQVTKISNTLPIQMQSNGVVVSCIEVGSDDDHLLVTFSNYGLTTSPYSPVWYTNDGGNTWISAGGNIEDMPIRWALINPNNRKEVLLATEAGVWSTDDITASPVDWGFDPNNGISRVRVDMLRKRKSDNLVLAATHGRGLFTSNIFNHPVAEFTASCNSSVISFTDHSNPLGSPITNWDWDFGDGSPHSNAQNPPAHTFPSSGGPFDVTLTITNANGIGTITHSITVGGNSNPVLSITTSNATCQGDCNASATITVVSGGVAPYSYNWSNGATASTTNTLCAGTIPSVIVTDANGCSSISQPSNPLGPSPISASITQPLPPSCFNGPFNLQIHVLNGGTSPYSVNLNGTQTSINGTNIIQFPWTTQNIGGSTPSFTISDSHSCTADFSILISQPQQLNISSTHKDVTCFGLNNGYFDVEAFGGTASAGSPLEFSLDNITYFPGTPQSLSWLYTFSGLSANPYTVYVKDNNGCTKSTTVQILEPNPITVSANQNQPVSCSGGNTMTANVTGGTVPYHYSWQPYGYTTSSVTGMPAGTYTLTITDANHCGPVTANVNVNEQAHCCGFFPSPAPIYSQSDFTLPTATSTTTLTLDGNLSGSVTIALGTVIIDGAQIDIPANSSITVYSGATLIIKNASRLFACGNMWKGIILNNGASLYVISPSPTTCKIEDAQYGIEARDGSTLYIDGCEFKNNFVGIKLSTFGTAGPIVVNGYITNSTFYSTGLLRNGNPSSTPDPLTHSFAGIWAENVSYFNIGAGGYYTPGVSMNYFHDMNFGIYSLNSFLDILGYRFQKIKMFDSFDGMPYISINAKPIMLGTAVFSGGNQSNSFLNMNGRNSATIPDFEECYKAIQSFGANVDIRSNRIKNCDDGVLVRQGHNLNIVIVQNYIDCNARGISLLLNGQSQQTFLQHNEIHGGLQQYRVNGSISKAIGIQTAEFNSTNPNAIINQNIIHLYNYGRIGIQSNAAERYIINYNTINLHNQINNTMVGISLSGSHANNINCNSVQGTFSGQLNYQNNEICFDIFDSRSNEIKCNTATNTSIGFRFSADCRGVNGQTIFRSNDIGNHFNGLLYTSSALVDPQDNRGNWWYLTTYPGYAAINLNPDHNSVLFEQYEVWANLSSHANLPIPAQIFVQAGVIWFQGVADLDENCGGPIHHSDCLFYTVNDGSGGGSYAADVLIALDSLNSSSYDEETKWKDKEALYEKLMLMPTYMDSSSILTDFYQSLAGTTIQQVASFHVSHNEIPPNESSLLQILENNSMSMYVKVDSIRACDSTLAIIGLSDTLKEIIKLKRKILIQQVKQTVAFNNQAFIALDSVVALNTDLLNDANDLINSSEIYEQNEQIINEAYLNSIEINEPELIYNSASSILGVAQQCPLAGGPAVHRARSLYMLINPDMVYNDELTCLQNGWLLKLAKDNQQLPVGVFPNPASIEVTITYSISNEQILQIIDNLGRIQMEILLNSNENRITTNISCLSNGIYTLHLGNKNNHENTMGRLTIIK